MRPAQQLLFPDPQPLVERLGRDFFRQLPECPGVYLMRDQSDAILYVGKAKNLRQRLGSYRVANPDRMRARHLRLLRAVARIELQECPDEAAALARESELLRVLRPKFNRAGTWSAPPRYFAWRIDDQQLRLAVIETQDPDWNRSRPLGRGSFELRALVARLLWLAIHPRCGFAGLPAGWFRGVRDREITIECGLLVEPVRFHLGAILSGQSADFSEWIRSNLASELTPFERGALEADLENLSETCQSLWRLNSER